MRMKAHRLIARLLAAHLVAIVVACGNDPASTGSGGAAGTSAAGTGQAGAKADGGSATAGSANPAGMSGAAGQTGGSGGGGGGTGSGGSKAGSCGPTAEVYKTSAACMGSNLPVFPLGYTLTTPMTAGQTYAIAYAVNGSETPTVEIWGTSSQCGDKVELLSSEKRSQGSYCVVFFLK